VKAFAYERPADAVAAVAAAAAIGDGEDAGRVRYLGGGTNLVDLMKLGVEAPERLVDVRRLAGHDAIEETADGGLRVGAGATNSAVAAHPLVRSRYPVLAQALLMGASGQLRNLATVGGNLLQRTRCAYFQDVTKPCNKREGGRDRDGCPAREGDHRNLAVIGHSDACVATHPSDMAVALTALGATVHVLGPGGERAIPMPGLHRLPGEEPQRDTVLEPGDLITAVALPPLPEALAAGSRYRKVRDRASFAFAVVSLAAAVQRAQDGTIADVRLALGGVAHVPWRAERAEAALRGGPATREAFAAAADAELEQARPLRDNAYKIPLARNLIIAQLEALTA
jgi:xanthine dehydrogenase YagS FAD-binding subunit